MPSIMTTNRKPEEIEKEIRGLFHELYLATPKEDASLVKARRDAETKARYQTENGLTIYNLRKAGNKVQVIHLRNMVIDGVPIPVPVPTYLKDVSTHWQRVNTPEGVEYDYTAGTHFYEMGGTTHVSIINKQDEKMLVTSVCHLADHYCYKMGIKVALDKIPPEVADKLLGK